MTELAAAPATPESLISDHLVLVGHIARETAARLPRHLGTDDLVGAGSLALVQAARSFDPTLGVPFGRFAATRIRGAMIDEMRARDWATRSLRSRGRSLAIAREQLTTALHREPSTAELAAASGLTEAEVHDIRQGTDRATILSLAPLTNEDAGLGASLPDRAPQPDEALVAAERMGYLRDAIAELPERMRVVVAGYYLDHRQLTELAEELGVTQSRCSQLRAEGLSLLREALEALLPSTGASTVGTNREPAELAAASPSASVKERRRNAYVTAVERRSDHRTRADVAAFLAGEALASAAPRS